ncbi:molybdate ABC transporter substrate-binding protein [Colwellia echini]|uniref:Molybdate ABC transporter substrate-binding protein n=1 Tax=Colwellia echini TaxID=1982103 RepID=A0ABY3N152_9GAMM|nr:molybdate ABC transporter substrate-binding protein [Colwellia echini]
MQKLLILTKQIFGANVLRFLLLSVTYICLSLFSAKSSQAIQANENNLRIAVAANFTPVLNILLEDFTKQTGIPTQVISGASGALFLQITHGAPFDIFLSADSRRPIELEQTGFTVENSRKTYALGQLAYYSSLHTDKEINNATSLLAILNTPPQRFAIANPDIAPYGKAAKETLISLGLWQIYQPRLITGINIGQTFTQLRSKAVSSGLIANSQLILNNLSGVVIPSDLHQPIEQQLVIIRASKQQANAQKLMDFLLSDATKQIIESYGYAKSSVPVSLPESKLSPQ